MASGALLTSVVGRANLENSNGQNLKLVYYKLDSKFEVGDWVILKFPYFQIDSFLREVVDAKDFELSPSSHKLALIDPTGRGKDSRDWGLVPPSQIRSRLICFFPPDAPLWKFWKCEDVKKLKPFLLKIKQS